MVSQYAGAAFAKQLFPLVGSDGVTALRVGLSALLLLGFLRPWRTPPACADIRRLLLYGVTIGCMNLLIYRAFALIPIGIAVAIEVTGPLTLVLLSSHRPRDFGWLACAVLGLWLLLPLHANAPALDLVGVACAFGAAACWALYIVFGKRASNASGGNVVAWGMLAASVFVVPVGAAHAGRALLAPAPLLGGLAVAALSSALPYTLEMIALRRLPQKVFGILVSASPAVSALAGFVVLGERLAALQWLAIGLVIAASAGSAWNAGRGQA
ncbi:EamA family transporter [Massilia terrae]|uniref:EamA family transporter n=1 Tax=Massilia terrae TaxID=1811224 RepID=A0ABT2D213_9BURK|nr:EamA family transporter [Massilia terrae]MCS0659393.1 EamA family transporter [Massilia terrae]